MIANSIRISYPQNSGIHCPICGMAEEHNKTTVTGGKRYDFPERKKWKCGSYQFMFAPEGSYRFVQSEACADLSEAESV